MTHPCNQCGYQATSARQLSRHKAVTHVKNPLSCILCPFVTAYQTNLLRHRREVHGILGSKGNKSCKFCGFEADDNDTLIVHQQQSHQDILKSARERFAREKKSARGNCTINNSNSDNSLDEAMNEKFSLLTKRHSLHNTNSQSLLMNNHHSGNNNKNNNKNINNNNLLNSSLMNSSMMNSMVNSMLMNSTLNNVALKSKLNFANLTKDASANNLINSSALFAAHRAQLQPESTSNNSSSNNQSVNDEDDDRDFWKEGFIDNPASLMDYNQLNATSSTNNNSFTSDFLANFRKNFNETFKLNTALSNQLDQLKDLNSNNMNDLTDLNLLNCFSSNLTTTGIGSKKAANDSTYQDGLLSAESDNASDDLSRPESVMSKSSNLEINLDNEQHSESLEIDSMHTQITKDDEIATTSISSQLAPTKIRRQYSCTDCDFKTVNPREFLYHRRDVHNQKVKIVECPYCVYACQYFQKLQRHMLLVHKLKTSITPPVDVNGRTGQQQIRSCPSKTKGKRLPTNNNSLDGSLTIMSSVTDVGLQDVKNGENITNKCPVCPYQSKWFSEVQKHMRVHTNEKPFVCKLCSFKTKWKGDLNRHIRKYHHLDPNDTQCQSNELDGECDGDNDDEDDDEDDEQDDDDDARMPHDDNDQNEEDDVEDRHHIEDEDEDEVNKNSNVSISSSLEDEDDENSNVEQEDDNGEVTFDNRNEGGDDDDDEIPLDFSVNASNNSNAPKLDTSNNKAFARSSATSLLEQRLSQIPPASHEPLQQKTISSTLTLRNLNDNLVKVYKCSYCDFICNTASRFHVHFVQHLNTKPFMCSVCEHRSSWQWDIRKHIKMKSQKGDHANAEAVLVHPSGKRDYRKYDKYLILINKNDIDGNSKQLTDTRGIIDPVALASLTNTTNTTTTTNQNNNHSSTANQNLISSFTNNPLSILSNSLNPSNLNLLNSLNNLGEFNNLNSSLENLNSLLGTKSSSNMQMSQDLASDKSTYDDEADRHDKSTVQAIDVDDDEEYFNESIMITPDISLTIGNEIMDLSALPSSAAPAVTSNRSSQNLPLNSSLPSSPLLINTTSSISNPSTPTGTAKPSKLFYCAYCDYTHRDSKSLVSHLSKHAGKKPFKCKLCGFPSNWREVLNRHVASRHSGTSADIEQLFKYAVSKYICRIIDDKGQIDPGPEVTTQATIKQQLPVSSGNLSNASSITTPVRQERRLATPPYQPVQELFDVGLSREESVNQNTFVPNIPDFLQNSLLMINSILAQQLTNFTNNTINNSLAALSGSVSPIIQSPPSQSSSTNPVTSNNFSNLANLSNFDNNLSSLNSLNSLTSLSNNPHQYLANKQSKLHTSNSANLNASTSSYTNSKPTPKPVETPEILAKHGIQGRVSGFKGDFKCDICPFKAEKAFHMDFHSKRHVKAPGADFKCEYCDYWVNAKKSLVKHVYLHKYKDVS